MTPPSHLAMARRRLLGMFRWLNPVIRWRIAAWERADGLTFLRKLGIAPGNVVLDFGSGPGHYSVPAALVVGERGMVCAVDRNAAPRRRLARRARALGLENIRLAEQITDVPALLDGRRCDAVLAYDVLHYMDADERPRLYRTFKELLTPRGLLSVHPKHVRDDAPDRHFFKDLTANDVAHEIEASGFCLRERVACTLWHAHGPTAGAVLNFQRADCGAESPLIP